jgi:hypothetical protein
MPKMESPRSKRQTGRTSQKKSRASIRGQSRTRASSIRSSRLHSATSRTRSRGQSGGAANSTKDLEDIRAWAEARGGKPATVKSTRGRGKNDGAGILRIDFPGYSGADSLEEISWEEWYDKFKENNLTFLYQDRTKDGSESRFFKLVCEPANRSSGGSRSRSRF